MQPANAKQTTARQWAEYAKQAKPHIRYAWDRDDTTVGAFDERLGRFVAVLARTICEDFPWITVNMELLVNGQPIAHEWVEV